MFAIGKWYSAKDIADVVGGELQTYLPQVKLWPGGSTNR